MPVGMPSDGCQRVVAGLILPFFWILVPAYASSESLLFETEELQVREGSERQCVQVGLFLTYRGPEPMAWSVLNMTLSYRGREGVLYRHPFVRISDFSGPVVGLSETPVALPSHSADAFNGERVRIINSRVLGRDRELLFAQGDSQVVSITESVNPATSRLELQAVGSPLLFRTSPNERLLVAVISFPVAPGNSGRVGIIFVPDDVVKDGNSLIGVDGRVLSAHLLDGFIDIVDSPLEHEAINLGAAILLLLGVTGAFLVIQRDLCRPWSRRRKVGALLLVEAVGLGVLLYLGRSESGSGFESSQAAGEAENRLAYGPASPFQFESNGIKIPGAYRFERRLNQFDLKAAADYLEAGFDAWDQQYRCVGCHTSGVYFLVRPMLTSLGPPTQSRRDLAVASLEELESRRLEVALKSGHRSAQVIYLAAGLSAWDRFVGNGCSPETVRANDLMFRLQDADGGWSLPRCWPPLQSSRVQLASVAAMAAGLASASGLDGGSDARKEGVNRLIGFLRTVPRTLDYDRVWLLWADSLLGGVLEAGARREISRMIFDRQHSDGGWSLREFGTADGWGDGSRRDRLVSEPDFYLPASDGHMTGLAVIALVESGIPVEDERIQRARQWIEKNQRASGRWWTSSLNTENLHLITYSGTCFCLLSLSRTGGLLRPEP